jgi:hypothetical protein
VREPVFAFEAHFVEDMAICNSCVAKEVEQREPIASMIVSSCRIVAILLCIVVGAAHVLIVRMKSIRLLYLSILARFNSFCGLRRRRSCKVVTLIELLITCRLLRMQANQRGSFAVPLLRYSEINTQLGNFLLSRLVE